jgi:hypothetical protein
VTSQPSDPEAPIFVGGLSTAAQSRVVTPASVPSGFVFSSTFDGPILELHPRLKVEGRSIVGGSL